MAAGLDDLGGLAVVLHLRLETEELHNGTGLILQARFARKSLCKLGLGFLSSSTLGHEFCAVPLGVFRKSCGVCSDVGLRRSRKGLGELCLDRFSSATLGRQLILLSLDPQLVSAALARW